MNDFNSNILKTVVPFYPSIDHQNHRKFWCKDQMRGFSLITHQLRFLPFQIVRPLSPVTTYTWELWSAIDDSFYTDITFPAGQIDTATVNGLDYITYFGTDVFDHEYDPGKFYIKWSDGTLTKYSEVFTIKCFTDDTLENLLRYGDDSQLVLYDLTEIIKTI